MAFDKIRNSKENHSSNIGEESISNTNTDIYTQSRFDGYDDGREAILDELRRTDIFATPISLGGDKSKSSDPKAGNRAARAKKEALRYITEAKDKAFAFWQVFEAVYGGGLAKDAWSERLHHNGKRTDLGELFADLEIEIGLSKPRASDGFYKGQLSRLVKDRTFMPVQRYLDSVYTKHSSLVEVEREYEPIEELDYAGGGTHKTNEMVFNPHPAWDSLANKLLGTDDQLTQSMFTLFLINCVRRAFEPGCIQKRVLVLKSSQDDGKSAFCSTLALGWGTELSHDKSEADIIRLMKSTWIMELAECDKHFKGREASTWKNLISTKTDKYIEKYETEVTEAPRVTCFIGTTNQDRFLTDPTGNKRFWVVEVAEGYKLPIPWLQENIDHIWATAYHLYKQGVDTDLTDDQKLESEARNREYLIEGSFVEQLERVLETATKNGAKNIAFKVLDVQMALGTHTDNQPKSKAAVINSLKQLGYAEKPIKVNGKTVRVYKLNSPDKPVMAKYEKGEWVYWSDKTGDWQLPHETTIDDRKDANGTSRVA